jgi:hypothetical protein
VFAVAVLGLAGAAARAADTFGHHGQQFFHGQKGKHFFHGPFQNKGKNFQTFHYFFKPTPTGKNFKSHTVFHFPHNSGNIRGGHFYFKNKDHNSPQFNKFWGRVRAGSDNYELIPENKRKENLEEIADADFVPQGKMTPVPGMEPKTPILPPPLLPIDPAKAGPEIEPPVEGPPEE